MKIYPWVTAGVFGLIVVAHIVRLIQEGPHVVHDPWFVTFTVVSALICGWGIRVGSRSRRP